MGKVALATRVAVRHPRAVGAVRHWWAALLTFHVVAAIASSTTVAAGQEVGGSAKLEQKTETTTTTTTSTTTTTVVTQSEEVASGDEGSTAEAIVPFRVPAAHHPWGRFPVGAWQRVRVTTESFGSEQEPAGRTVLIRTERLIDRTDDGYKLATETTVDVAGQTMARPTRESQFEWHSGADARVISETPLADEHLTIDENLVKCRVLELELRGDLGTLSSRVYYTPDQSPHIMQRELRLHADDPTSPPQAVTLERTIILDAPFRRGDAIYASSWKKIVRVTPKGRSVEMLIHVDDIPGGTVASWTTELDSGGARVRWSNLELLDFGTQVEERPPRRERRRLLRRRRVPAPPR